MVDQTAGMPRSLAVELDGIGGDEITTEGMRCFGDCDAFTGARIDDGHWTVCGSERGQHSLQG